MKIYLKTISNSIQNFAALRLVLCLSQDMLENVIPNENYKCVPLLGAFHSVIITLDILIEHLWIFFYSSKG